MSMTKSQKYNITTIIPIISAMICLLSLTGCVGETTDGPDAQSLNEPYIKSIGDVYVMDEYLNGDEGYTLELLNNGDVTYDCIVKMLISLEGVQISETSKETGEIRPDERITVSFPIESMPLGNSYFTSEIECS